MEKLIVSTLVDNGLYDKRLTPEYGFSLFIEYENINILFDTGYSNLFLQNAKKMAIDLNLADTVVITHRHKSHSGGLPHLLRVLKSNTNFIIEPEYFNKFSKNLNGRIAPGYIDYIKDIKKYLLNHKVTLLKQKEFVYLKNIYFFTPFDAQESKYPLNKFNIRNSTAMVIDTKSGLFLFMGAAHSRFNMILDWIFKKFPKKSINTVFGGININFKRQRDVEIVKNSISRIKINNFQLSHCSGINEYNFLKEFIENVYFNGAGKVLKFSSFNSGELI